MNENVYFSATMQKSPMSIPARVMVERNLNRVVYFVLRGGSDSQRQELYEFLDSVLIERVPLKRARREMIICTYMDYLSVDQHFDSYEVALQHVFGEKCRIRVRVMWRGELR